MSHRHAQYSLGDYKGAADAFDRGLKQDPTNASLKAGLQNAQSRIVPDDAASTSGAPTSGAGAPNLAAMADMLRGGAGRGGGMPDLASLMNNPQVMNMAQQLASNGGLANLMQNPAVANMVELTVSNENYFRG